MTELPSKKITHEEFEKLARMIFELDAYVIHLIFEDKLMLEDILQDKLNYTVASLVEFIHVYALKLDESFKKDI